MARFKLLPPHHRLDHTKALVTTIKATTQVLRSTQPEQPKTPYKQSTSTSNNTMAPTTDLVQLLNKLSINHDYRTRPRGCSKPGTLLLSNGIQIRNLPVPTDRLSCRPWESKAREGLPMIFYQPSLPMPPIPRGTPYYPGGNTDIVGFPTIPSLLAIPKVFPAHQGYLECSSPVLEGGRDAVYAALGFCMRDARVDPATTMPPCTIDPELAHKGVVRTCADRCHLEPHKLCEWCSDQSRLLLLNGLPEWFTNSQIVKSRAFLCAPCSAEEAQQAPRWAEAEATLSHAPVHTANTNNLYEPGAIAKSMERFHNDPTFPVATPPTTSSLAQALADNTPSQVRTAKKMFGCSCRKLITADLCLGHRLFRADQFLDQVKRMNDWIQFRFSLREQDPKPCPKCLTRHGVDAFNFKNKVGGAHLNTVSWMCMCCQETVSMSRYEFFHQGGSLGQERDDQRLAELMGGLGF